MSEQPSETAERMAAMAKMLPDDPMMASMEALALGAVVSIRAGLSDQDALSALDQALHHLRDGGLGEGRH